MFRGFLLTSLMKWIPPYQAVLISSLLFGCAHLSVKDLPYLTAVGYKLSFSFCSQICSSMIWGFAYMRSRNLATPMLMHGLWNSTVLTILYLFAALGFDLKQLI